jgi:hypothetical protein
MRSKSWSSGAVRNRFWQVLRTWLSFADSHFYAKDIGAEDEVGLAVMAEMGSLENVGKKLLGAASSVVNHVRINVRPRLQVE